MIKKDKYSLYKNPELWGGPAWTLLHCITYTYPNNPTPSDMKDYEIFFLSLQNVLPCPTCREHYSNYIKKNPISNHLLSKTKLITYFIKLRNYIDKHYKNKKPLTIQQSKNLIDFNIKNRLYK
tara:strand:+ start:864 stop:1232 length:369 start_codon:yes stop_codon:yes gene_type:complete